MKPENKATIFMLILLIWSAACHDSSGNAGIRHLSSNGTTNENVTSVSRDEWPANQDLGGSPNENVTSVLHDEWPANQGLRMSTNENVMQVSRAKWSTNESIGLREILLTQNNTDPRTNSSTPTPNLASTTENPCPNQNDDDDDDEFSRNPILLSSIQDPEEARRLSHVDKSYLESFVPPSFAGFLTANNTLGNHLFFWYFPSPGNVSAPLLMWLNGGPTITSMQGLLFENGPIELDLSVRTGPNSDSDVRYFKRQHSWVGPFSVLYVDNPVNTGYSFSEFGSEGDRVTESGYTGDLFNFLQEFFRIFPKCRLLDFYIGGQSYAGNYVISLAHFLHTEKENGRSDISFTGIYLGGPFFDSPRHSETMADFLYHTGVCTYNDVLRQKRKVRDFFRERNSSAPLRPEVSLYEVFYTLVPRGVTNNLVTREHGPAWKIIKLMNSSRFRKALHTGNRRFKYINKAAHFRFGSDLLNSRRDKMAALMSRYKVLIFTGDLDTVVSTSMVEASLLTTPWERQAEYNATSRTRVYCGNCGNGDSKRKIAYHYSHVGQFCRVIVSGAGHQTPRDQPEATLHMMKSFVEKGCL